MTSFYQILDDNYDVEMKFPISFSVWYKEQLMNTIPKSINVQTSIWDWDVETGTSGGVLCITGIGWANLVTMCSVGPGYILLFKVESPTSMFIHCFDSNGLRPYDWTPNDLRRYICYKMLASCWHAMRLALEDLVTFNDNDTGFLWLLTHEGKWRVKYWSNAIGKVFLYGIGWKLFVEENFLEAGDVLKVKPLSVGRFKVVVYGMTHLKRENIPVTTFFVSGEVLGAPNIINRPS